MFGCKVLFVMMWEVLNLFFIFCYCFVGFLIGVVVVFIVVLVLIGVICVDNLVILVIGVMVVVMIVYFLVIFGSCCIDVIE